MTGVSPFVTIDAYVPLGPIRPDHLIIREQPVSELRDREVLVEAVAISVRPSMRGQLTGRHDHFRPAFRLGEPLTGPVIARVSRSRHPLHHEGSLVSGWLPWAERSVWREEPGTAPLLPLPVSDLKPSYALGVFGLPGLTAYFGTIAIGEVGKGQTLLISSAAGTVGSLAGQIGKLRGARVIGITSTAEKQQVLTGQLGFDAALDHRSPDFADQLRNLAPGGADVYFDNVGGQISQIVMKQMRRPARIVECGQIAIYDDDDGTWMVDIKPIHANGLRLEALHVGLFEQEWPKALADLSAWIRSGAIRAVETEWHGLDKLPLALASLFRGDGVGNLVVSLNQDGA